MDMDMDGLPPRAAVQRMVATYFISHVVRTMAVLEIADHLADGPRSVTELAAATATHPTTLARFLRAAAALGLCTTAENGSVQLTPRGVSCTAPFSAIVQRPSAAAARRKRARVGGCVSVAAASSVTLRGPSAKWSASPSTAMVRTT